VARSRARRNIAHQEFCEPIRDYFASGLANKDVTIGVGDFVVKSVCDLLK
jgi:hypothetical protein